ncbi:MAG: helix-turn-helix domain-containing protein [Rhodobacteraceae bacterium]|nr:helix-turn-helix domain-containing protein [Paracoccaceae bacterium]
MSTGKLQTLERGIALLRLVSQSPEGIRINDLAAQLELNRPTAYRIVATLVDQTMVRRLDDGRIVMGVGAYQLGARSSDSIQLLAGPVLETLAEETGSTSFLSMAEGDTCVVVMTAEPRDTAFNIHYKLGTRHPITRGAAGIAILASRPEQPQDSEDIRFARANGYSVTKGQLHKGAVGVSSAVRLKDAGLTGLEFSIGVVALESLDIKLASKAVPAAAENLVKALS